MFPEVQLGDYLFVMSNGKQISKFQNYPGKGSLLYQFGCVTGLENFCFKMLRKSMEGTIQSSDTLSNSTKDLNSHSQAVARKVYDKMKGARRNVFLTNLNKQQGRKLRDEKPIENYDMEKRNERNKKEAEELKHKAQTFLAELKKQEPWDERPTAVNQEDERLLKSVFSKDMIGKFHFIQNY